MKILYNQSKAIKTYATNYATYKVLNNDYKKSKAELYALGFRDAIALLLSDNHLLKEQLSDVVQSINNRNKVLDEYINTLVTNAEFELNQN